MSTASAPRSSRAVSLSRSETPRKRAKHSSFCAALRALRKSPQKKTDFFERWLARYSRDPAEGLHFLVQSISEATGGDGNVTPEMLEGEDGWTDVVNFMKFNYNYSRGQEYPVEDPFFCENLRSFFVLFVRKCDLDVLCDGFIVPNMLKLLSAMSASKVVAFRLTSTVIVLGMLTGFIEVLETIAKRIACAQNVDPEGSPRTEEELGERLRGQKAILRAMNRYKKEMFSILQDRFRDILPEIRSMCLKEMRLWVSKSLQHVESSAIGTLPLSFYDKNPEVCQQALQVAMELVEAPKARSSPRIQGFVHRFHQRLLHLTLVEDMKIAVLAIDLFALILRHMPDSLPEELTQDLFLYVYSRYPAIAEAGSHLVEAVAAKDAQTNLQCLRTLASYSSKTLGGEHMILHWLTGKSSSAKWVTDYDSMISLLLRESDMDMPAELDDREELTLVYVFCISVKWLATEQQPPRIMHRGLLPVPTDNSELNSNFRTPTSIKRAYPKLLEKFQFDQEKILPLVRLLLYLNIHLRETAEHIELIKSLLTNLHFIFETSREVEVLKEVARFICSYCSAEKAQTGEDIREDIYPSFSQSVLVVVRTILTWLEPEEIEDSVDYMTTLNVEMGDNFKKLFAASSYGIMTGYPEVWDLVRVFLARIASMSSTGGCSAPTEAFEYAASAYCLHLGWELKRLQAENAVAAETELKKPVDNFVAVLLAILNAGQEEYHTSAYVVMCEALSLMKHFGIRRYVIQRFQDLTEAIMAKEVFTKDADGKYTCGTRKERSRIFEAFVLTRIRRCIAVKEMPAIFQYYTEYRDDFGKFFETLLQVSKQDDELSCIQVILYCLNKAYVSLGSDKDQLQVLAKDLSALFGSPKGKATALQFHVTNLMITVKHKKLGERFTFVEITSVFEKIMKQSSFDEVSAFLRRAISTSSGSGLYTDANIYRYMKEIRRFAPSKHRLQEDRNVDSVTEGLHGTEEEPSPAASRSDRSKRRGTRRRKE